MKLPTPLEAAARADEGHTVASGLGLDEVAALLRSMARGSSGTEHAFTPEDAWDELVHKDDRTSPEEYPDHCLITFKELQDFMLRLVTR